MKYEKILIGLLCAFVAWNSYTIFEKDNNNNTAILVLDERIVNTEDSIKNILNYIKDDSHQIKNQLRTEIASLGLELNSHKHKPVYVEIEKEVVIENEELPIEEKELEIEEVVNTSSEELIVSTVDNTATTEVVKKTTSAMPMVVSCPKVHNRLGRYIENTRISRDYTFIIDYDVKNKQVTNVEFSKSLPNSLQRAMIRYLNSFQMYGDTGGCSLSIKILKN